MAEVLHRRDFLATVTLAGVSASSASAAPASQRGRRQAAPNSGPPTPVARPGPKWYEADPYPRSPKTGLMQIPRGKFRWKLPEGDVVVEIDRDYYLAQCEVTYKQFRTVMRVNKQPAPSDPDVPVERVSWLEAAEFCNKLSQSQRLPEYYKIFGSRVEIETQDPGGYRLPTEAEWEYACRAGTATAYWFGDDERRLDDFAWWDGNSAVAGDKQPVQVSHPVGTTRAKIPNSFGLFDVHGNVAEWTGDWYDPRYGLGPGEVRAVTNPRGPDSGSERVVKGGSYRGQPEELRSAARDPEDPRQRRDYIGFRIARSIVRPAAPVRRGR